MQNINELLQPSFGTMQSAAGRLRVRSALNPALWMLIAVPPFLGAGLLVDDPILQWFLFSLAGAPICLNIIGFIFLLIFDRDKLQSEDFQLRKQVLDLHQIQQEGEAPHFPAQDDLVPNLKAISSPPQEPLEGEGQ